MVIHSADEISQISLTASPKWRFDVNLVNDAQAQSTNNGRLTRATSCLYNKLQVEINLRAMMLR
jgi:hypothetical protein